MRAAVRRAASESSAERFLEGRRRHFFEGQPEDVAMRAESLEGPSEIGLSVDAVSATGGDDAEQTQARCAALVLPAKSMLRRSLATFCNRRSAGELSIGTRGSWMKRKSTALCRW